MQITAFVTSLVSPPEETFNSDRESPVDDSKYLSELKELRYRGMVAVMDLSTLEERIMRGMITTLRFLNWFDAVDWEQFFEISSVRSERVHSKILSNRRVVKDVKKYCYGKNDEWNKLSKEMEM